MNMVSKIVDIVDDWKVIEKADDKVTVVDTNIGLDHALGIAKGDYEVYYSVVHASAFPKLEDEICGLGFDEINKVWDWAEGLENGSSVVVFTDSGFGYLADWLRSKGYAVFGADDVSERLELDRVFVRKVADKIGVKVPPADVVKGIDAVVDVIRNSDKKRYVKVSRFRGGVETFGTNDPEEARIMLMQGGFSIVGNDVWFVVEESLEGMVEVGVDALFNGKEFLGKVFDTIEMKGAGNFTQVIDIDESIWSDVLRKFEPWLRKNGYHGFFCLEGFYDGNDIYVTDVTPRYPYICVTPDTEIYTKRGWVRFDELREDDEVWTVNLMNPNEAKFVKPKKIFKVWYEGDLVVYESRNRRLRFEVTPDHKFFVVDINKGRRLMRKGKKEDVYKCYEVKSAKELMKNTYVKYMIPRVMYWNRGKYVEKFILPGIEKGYGNGVKYHGPLEIDMDTWLQFLGWFLSEGCISHSKKGNIYKVSISQYKEENRKEIERVLSRLPFNWRKEGGSYVITDKQLFVWILENCYDEEFRELFKRRMSGEKVGRISHARHKKIPEFIKELVPGQIQVFLNAFIKGDGHIGKTSIGNDTRTYSTTSKSLADGIQELILRKGGYATIYVSAVNEKGEPTYNVHEWIRGYEFANINPKNFKIRKYRGWVYDVEVEPWHAIYLRKDGIPFWTANCSHAYPRIIENYADVIVGVARGEDIEPKVNVEYSAQIGVYTDDPDRWRIIRYSGEDREWIAYRRVIKKGDYIWFVPGDYVVAVAISGGNNIDQVVEEAIERSEKVSSTSIYTQGREFKQYLHEVLEKMNELGISW